MKLKKKVGKVRLYNLYNNRLDIDFGLGVDTFTIEVIRNT